MYEDRRILVYLVRSNTVISLYEPSSNHKNKGSKQATLTTHITNRS